MDPDHQPAPLESAAAQQRNAAAASADAAPPLQILTEALAPLLPPAGTRLLVDHVKVFDQPVAGDLADYLHQLLSEAASSRPGVGLVSRDAQNEVLALLTLWASDAYDPDALPELGKLQGAQHLLRCRFVELAAPPRVRLSLELVEIDSGLSQLATVELARGSLPAHLSAQASNASRISRTLGQWRREVPVNAFVVDLWTDRGVGANYKPGEALRVFVRSQRAGTLALDLLDANGETQRFFPNFRHADDSIPAVGVLEIPDASMGFQLTINGTEGNEVVRALVFAEDGSRAQALCGYRITTAR